MTHTSTPVPAPRATPAGRGKRAIRTDIQALRALAVAAVLAYHFAPALLPGGYVGVDIFFVISGFVITSLMVSEIRATGALSFSKFYARRARRILPAATATIVATVGVGMLIWPLNLWQPLAADAFYTGIFAQNWHLAAQSVDYLAGGQAPSPMQHFWSLSIEEQFYFLWPAALMGAYALIRRFRPGRGVRSAAVAVLVPTIVITFAWSVAAVVRGDASAYFTTHTRAWQLAVGALLAVGWPALSRLTGNTGGPLEPGTAPRSWRTMALQLTGGALIAVALLAYTSHTPFPGAAALLPTLGTAALIAAGRPAGRVTNTTPVQWTGNVSYSLYLVHWPLVVFLPDGALWAGIGLIASLVLADLSYRHIEQGLPRRFGLRTNRRTLLAGALAVGVALAASASAHTVFTRSVATLDAEADELQADAPAGLGAGSIDHRDYRALLPGYSGTTPSRAKAREDLPQGYADGCVGANEDRQSPMCEYGPTDAETTWVLVGDSHMDQYLPAFVELAEDQGIHLITFFHANCPFNLAQTEQDVEWGGPCQASNAHTLSELAKLDDVDLIVTSNWTQGEWASGEDPVAGFVDAWSKVAAPVVVIADNPEMLPADETTTCVVDHFPHTEDCAIAREDALPVDHQLPAAREAAERGEHVRVVDLTEAYCTDTECPPVIGNVMVYRDPHHVTATYMKTIAPLLAAKLAEATGE